MKALPSFCKVIQSSIIASSIFTASYSYSGVVVNGTRIIFENGQQEKAVQLNNKDRHPNLVQIWSDKNQPDSSPENADGPFMTNPQIFKMNPQQGQIVRLRFIGQSSELPQDRESLFYLNINEIPALKASDLEANRLVVSFTNRLKILYRPKGLQGHATDAFEQVNYQIQNGQIRLNNPTNYYAHIAEIKMTQNGRIVQQDKSLMIAPNDQLIWSAKPVANTATEINAVFINDYGARVQKTIKASPEN